MEEISNFKKETLSFINAIESFFSSADVGSHLQF